MGLAERLEYTVAGVRYVFRRKGEFPDFAMTGEHARFVTGEAPAHTITIDAAYSPSPLDWPPGGEPVFDSGGLWRLYESDGHPVYTFGLPEPGARPYRLLSMEAGHTHGELTCTDLHLSGVAGAFAPVNEYPLDEVLMVGLCSLGYGVELHALGIIHEGCALLFAGSSGAGKSTLGRYFTGVAGVSVLSDDRILVRRAGDGGFVASGTPWHGEAGLSEPLTAPLRAVCFLRQAAGNSLLPIPRSEAVERALVCSFPPFWSAEGMGRTLDILGEMAGAVPVFEFAFHPGPEAVELLMTGLGASACGRCA